MKNYKYYHPKNIIGMFKKRGYFFTLDAVLGLTVLVIGVFLITSYYINVQQPVQVGLLADDLMGFLSNTKIKDLNNAYAGIGGQLWTQGTITDADNSLLQQIGEFYKTSNLDIAEKFVQNVSKDVVPPQYLYEVWVEGMLIYPKSPSQHDRQSDHHRRRPAFLGNAAKVIASLFLYAICYVTAEGFYAFGFFIVFGKDNGSWGAA